jgi:hypothetical protein
MPYRILFLRPFWDSELTANYLQIVHRVTRHYGKLVAIKNKDEDSHLRLSKNGNAWAKYGKIGAWVYDRVNPALNAELISATDGTWQEIVIAQMQLADAIIVLVGLDSPNQDLASLDSLIPNISPSPEIDFSLNPIRQFTYRIGVLRELDYCQQTNSFGKVIALIPDELLPRIEKALDIIQMTHHGQFLRRTPKGFVPLSGRIRGTDFALIGLRSAHFIIPYSHFGGALFAIRLFDALRATLGNSNPSEYIHVNTPNNPVALPPDGKLKLIRFTPIQNLTKIPSGEIVELSYEEVQVIKPGISREEFVCPSCGNGPEKMFLFQYGLEPNLEQSSSIFMYCQYCRHEDYL